MNYEEIRLRLILIQQEIAKLYKEKEELAQIILDNQFQDIDLNSYVITSTIEKKIDFDKLAEKYPTVYEWGLKPTFDFHKALRCFDDKDLFWKIMRECRKEPKLKLKNIKKKRGGKNAK